MIKIICWAVFFFTVVCASEFSESEFSDPDFL